MRIAKETNVKSSVFNALSISPERPEKKDPEKGQYIEYKHFATPEDIALQRIVYKVCILLQELPRNGSTSWTTSITLLMGNTPLMVQASMT